MNAQRFRVIYGRVASALLSVREPTRALAVEAAQALIDSDDPRHRPELTLAHRFWVFDDEVSRLELLAEPDGEEAAWVIRLERKGIAVFTVEAANRDEAVHLAHELLTRNEKRFPVESRFWHLEPDFTLVDVARGSAG